MKDVQVYLFLHSITRSRAVFTVTDSMVGKIRIDTDDIVDLTPVNNFQPLSYDRVKCLVRIPYNIAVAHDLEPRVMTGKPASEASGEASSDSDYLEKIAGGLDKDAVSEYVKTGNVAALEGTRRFKGLKSASVVPLNKRLADDAMHMEQEIMDRAMIMNETSIER
jgi:hypothetical protein